jgi:hypothetical protein
MLEKLLELLAALAVRISAAIGISTASDKISEHVPESTGLERAASHAPARVADDEVAAEAADGIATALEALEQALENAPEQADAGLQRAMDAVGGEHGLDALPAPAVDAANGPPAELPPTEPPGRP